MLELGPLLTAAILGIVEGLTEFLPISSTGHLILASELLGFEGEKENAFLIIIQTGAMLAVMWQYRVKFTDLTIGLFTRRDAQIFVAKLFVAFLPAAIVGLLLGDLIKANLFGSKPVAVALIVGAFVILAVERFYKSWRVESVDDMTFRDALMIGLAQCLLAHSRRVARRRHHHRRHAVRPVAQGGDRVLVLPRGADADRGRRLRSPEASRRILGGRHRASSRSG